MTLLHPAPVSYRLLTWQPGVRQFVAEASDLRGTGQVWDDSCDEGFTIIGKTGREIVVVLTDEKRDADGDVQFWTFEPADRADRALINKVVVFNDRQREEAPRSGSAERGASGVGARGTSPPQAAE